MRMLTSISELFDVEVALGISLQSTNQNLSSTFSIFLYYLLMSAVIITTCTSNQLSNRNPSEL